jgi:hypothetical protein
MDIVGVATLLLTAMGLIAYGMWTPNGTIQYPFLAGAIVLGWMGPQAIGLLHDPAMPQGALAKVSFFGAACLIACLAGYRHGQRGTFEAINWNFENKLLYWVSFLLSVVGGLFYLEVRGLAEEAFETYSGQWSGSITIYYFFSRLLTYGLLLAVVGHIQSPSKGWLVIIVFDSLFYLDRIIFQGRRTEMFEIALAIATFMWLYKRVAIPKWLAALSIVLATLAVYSVGEYRGAVQFREKVDWKDVFDIEVIDNFKEVLEKGGDEFRNAALIVEATDRTMWLDYGSSLWNMLVFQYVPGQLVGSSEKTSFMLDLPDAAYAEFGHVPYTGTTLTGFSDAFASFWYFGFIKFYLIAFIVGRLYNSAFRGNLTACLLLMVTLTPALLAYTHSTNWFFKDVPQIILFFILPLWYAKHAPRLRGTPA